MCGAVFSKKDEMVDTTPQVSTVRTLLGCVKPASDVRRVYDGISLYEGSCGISISSFLLIFFIAYR